MKTSKLIIGIGTIAAFIAWLGGNMTTIFVVLGVIVIFCGTCYILGQRIDNQRVNK